MDRIWSRRQIEGERSFAVSFSGTSEESGTPLAARLRHPQALPRFVPHRCLILQLSFGPLVRLVLAEAREITLHPRDVLVRTLELPLEHALQPLLDRLVLAGRGHPHPAPQLRVHIHA